VNNFMISAADGSHDEGRSISIRIVSCWRFEGKGVKSHDKGPWELSGRDVYPLESDISM